MKLATQIFLGFLIAIGIDLLDSFVNYMLTLRVNTMSNFLNRSEVVIRQSSELDKSMLEMQIAFRGYLATGDSGFLTAYYEDLKTIPIGAGQMRRLVSLPEQVQVVDSILFLHNRWVDYANGLIAVRKRDRGLDTAKKFNGLLGSLKINGVVQEYDRRISLLFRSLNAEEYRQRNLRRQDLADSIWRTDSYSLIFSILLILIGLTIALILVRKISRRIRSLVKLAESISQGNFGQVRDEKRDELTSLSVSLNLVSERLSRSISELEKKNAELNQFAYVVSHDLKAPVRGISNVVRWIEEDHGDEISPDVRNYLDFIPERVSRMEGLIDGLLEYARAGRDGTEKIAVDVGQLVRDMVDLIVPDGCILRVGILPIITTERLPLQQVLSNLIGNSVKHGTTNKLVITVTGEEFPGYYEFTVEDNGPGIDPQYHERIFGLFQTLREKEDKESTGIGLSIVKKIVEERGGGIRVLSKPGNGAKFIFTWPK